MFSHVMVGANDVAVSTRFYDAVLGVLGIPAGTLDDRGRAFYMTRSGMFMVAKPINGEPASSANGSTIGFSAKSIGEVDRWYEIGASAGGTREAPPAVREGSFGKLYTAYLRDPAGNKLCALHRIAS